MGGLYFPTKIESDETSQKDLFNSVTPTTSQVLGNFRDAYLDTPIMGAALRRQEVSGAGFTPFGTEPSYEDPKALNDKYGIDGHLDFSKVGPRTSAQAKVMYNRKLRELERMDARQRDPGVSWSAVGQDLVANLLDPYAMGVGALALPSKAIPGLNALSSVARSQSPLAVRAASSFATGTVDTAFGVALTEPFNLYSHQYVGDEYDAANSLYTISLGGLAGGTLAAALMTPRVKGLHVVDDTTPDFMNRTTTQTHEKAFELAIRQAIAGEDVNVKPLVEADPRIKAEVDLKPVIQQHAEVPTLSDVVESMPAERLGEATSDLGFVASHVAKLPHELADKLFGSGHNLYVEGSRGEIPQILNTELTQVGEQLGSNPGGRFATADGSEYYVKFHQNPEQAKSELAAHILYSRAEQTVGVSFSPEFAAVTKDGKVVGVATKWQNNLKPVSPDDLAMKIFAKDGDPVSLTDAEQLANSWVFDAWIGNRDVYGTGPTWNLLQRPEGGYTKLDFGGALDFRAKGEPKLDFTPDVTELSSFQHHGGGDLIAAASKSPYYSIGAEMVLRLSPQDIKSALRTAGIEGDRLESLYKTLLLRQERIRDEFADVAHYVDRAHFNKISHNEFYLGSNWLNKLTEKFKGLFTAQQLNALSKYQDGSTSINASLWGKHAIPAYAADVEGHLATMFQKDLPNLSDKSVVLWHWARSSWMKGADAAEFDIKSLEKTAFLNKGYLSTSSAKYAAMAKDGSRDVLFKIDVEPGVKGIPVQLAHKELGTHNPFQNEIEVLLNKGQLMAIDSVQEAEVMGRMVHVVNAKVINPDRLGVGVSPEELLSTIKNAGQKYFAKSDTFDDDIAKLVDQHVNKSYQDVPTLTDIVAKTETKTPMMKAVEEEMVSLEAELKAMEVDTGKVFKDQNEVIKQAETYPEVLKKAWTCYLGGGNG